MTTYTYCILHVYFYFTNKTEEHLLILFYTVNEHRALSEILSRNG
jgi:hypothetical protein